MEDGQQKEKVWNDPLPLACPLLPIASDLLSLFLPTSRVSQTFSAVSHPPTRPFSSCLPQPCPCADSVPIPQIKTKAWPLPKGAVIIQLFLSLLPLISQLGKGGRKGGGGPWGEQSPHGLLTGSSYQGEKGGALLPPDRWEVTLSSATPTRCHLSRLGSLEPHQDHWPHTPHLHLPAPGRWRHVQFEGWEARQAPPKRPSLTPGIST